MIKLKNKFFYVWVGLLIVIFSVIFLGQWFRSRGLIFAETLTEVAEVVKYQPENHAAVYYEYAVKGSLYQGAGSVVGYAVGDKIEIRYSREKPWLSEISQNLQTPGELIIFSIVGSLFMSTAATLMFFLISKSVRKSVQSPLK